MRTRAAFALGYRQASTPDSNEFDSQKKIQAIYRNYEDQDCTSRMPGMELKRAMKQFRQKDDACQAVDHGPNE